MPDGSSSYLDIALTIKDEVLSGKYSGGTRFPSLTRLMRRFSVSRMTALRAVEKLKKDGMVESRRGKGVFVSKMAQKFGGRIGLIVPGLSYAEIFPPICREISRLVQERGFKLLLGEISSDDAAERARLAVKVAHQFAEENVVGVFFQPLEFLKDSVRANHEILSVFDTAGIPVVLLDSDIVMSPARSKYDLVGINNFEAGRRLAQHLLEHGVRNIGFMKSAYCDFSVQNRYEGVKSVISAGGGTVASLAFSADDCTALKRFLVRKPRPDAIVCRNDHQAAHLLVSLRKLGERVPDYILVAGFNDVEYASILNPSLTTVHVPCAAIAQMAFTMLFERIQNQDLLPRESYLASEVVVRESTLKSKEIRKNKRTLSKKGIGK